MTTSLLRDAVAETLLIPLYMRACESAKDNPIIDDPTAIALVDTLRSCYDFTRFHAKPASAVGSALRARHFDIKAHEFLLAHPDGVIVNVGCGLDARLQRLGNIAQQTPFYSLDIAETMALRQALLPALPNEHYLSASMFESAWLDLLKDNYPDAPILFIVEGVMMYFDEALNRQFFVAVAERFQRAEIYFDCASSFAVKNSHRHDTVKHMKARFHCAIDDVTTCQHWHPRWRYAWHAYFGDFDEVWRMGKLLGFAMRYLPPFKKSFVMLGYRLLPASKSPKPSNQ